MFISCFQLFCKNVWPIFGTKLSIITVWCFYKLQFYILWLCLLTYLLHDITGADPDRPLVFIKNHTAATAVTAVCQHRHTCWDTFIMTSVGGGTQSLAEFYKIFLTSITMLSLISQTGNAEHNPRMKRQKIKIKQIKKAIRFLLSFLLLSF